MTEPVRLVIWDLDETFWEGTLTEGGISFRPDTIEIVKELARRGIVSSICSKNDLDQVKLVLEAEGIWEYFVFPSINWDPKGPRIAQLIEAVQLRPGSVMFIDDNQLNLSEAQHITPDLQVRSHEFIPEILRSPLFSGKPDGDLKRLSQYRILERRKADETKAGTDVRDFLRLSQIRVYIERDVSKYLDRAVELINRTNQLNYTKVRLSEDPKTAREQLLAQLSSHEIQAGMLRVVDRYGDHGWCGIYMLHNSGRLLQYAFSCRILGMGVEAWLYNRLGRPKIEVEGNVLIDLSLAPSDIDWITLDLDGQVGDTHAHSKTLASRIISRGGCDLMAVSHYFGLLAPLVLGEFNENRLGMDGRVDHSMFLYQALTGASSESMAAARGLGYADRDFCTHLSGEQTDSDVWLLSFWTDAAYVLYEHSATGLVLPFAFPGYNQGDARSANIDNLLTDPKKERMCQALRELRASWKYIGFITEADFKRNLSEVLSRALPSTKTFLLGANEYWVNSDGFGEILERTRALNRWTGEVVQQYSNVHFVNIRDFVTSENEVHTPFHFDRMVYVRVFEFIEASLRQDKPLPVNKTWAFHESIDPLKALEGNESIFTCSRTAAFLLKKDRASEAATIASLALDLAPENLPARILLAEAQNKSGQRHKAAGIIRQVFAEFASSQVSVGILMRLANAFYESQYFSYAEDLYRELSRREPANLVHRHRLANTLSQQGDKHQAYLILKSCLDDGDINPHVQAHVCRILFDLEHWNELEELLSSSLLINPNFVGLIEIKSKLLSRNVLAEVVR